MFKTWSIRHVTKSKWNIKSAASNKQFVARWPLWGPANSMLYIMFMVCFRDGRSSMVHHILCPVWFSSKKNIFSQKIDWLSYIHAVYWEMPNTTFSRFFSRRRQKQHSDLSNMECWRCLEWKDGKSYKWKERRGKFHRNVLRQLMNVPRMLSDYRRRNIIGKRTKKLLNKNDQT